LIKAVVAPIAAATGSEGKMIAPTQGSAVPITVPPIKVPPAAKSIYFCESKGNEERKRIVRFSKRYAIDELEEVTDPISHDSVECKLEDISERLE